MAAFSALSDARNFYILKQSNTFEFLCRFARGLQNSRGSEQRGAYITEVVLFCEFARSLLELAQNRRRTQPKFRHFLVIPICGQKDNFSRRKCAGTKIWAWKWVWKRIS